MTVKGPKGTLSHTVVDANHRSPRRTTATLRVTRPDDERDSRARHGLTRTLVNNMVVGVTQGYSKALEIVGVGYRVTAKGSGPRVRPRLLATRCRCRRPTASPSWSTPRSKFRVEGIDKQLVGEVAANIRKLRKPDPYKGKGVRYAGEVVRRKVGKTGK